MPKSLEDRAEEMAKEMIRHSAVMRVSGNFSSVSIDVGKPVTR